MFTLFYVDDFPLPNTPAAFPCPVIRYSHTFGLGGSCKNFDGDVNWNEIPCHLVTYIVSVRLLKSY